MCITRTPPLCIFIKCAAPSPLSPAAPAAGRGHACLPRAAAPESSTSGSHRAAKPRRSVAQTLSERSGFDFPPIDRERAYAAVDALEEVAKARGATIARTALAWLLAQPGVTSVILGANKMEQLEDNLQAADLELTPEEVAKLSAVTQPPTLYPQWMIDLQNSTR